MSQALAVAEDREIVEAKLWQKVISTSRGAGIPLDDEAPDFICAASAAPPVGVFRLAQDPNEVVGDEATTKESSVFNKEFQASETKSTEDKKP